MLYGFINNKGSLLIPLKYKTAGNFNEGLAVVKTMNDELVIIDKKGKETTIKNKEYAANFLSGNNFSFNEGMCPVLINKKYGFINTKGEDVIACEYESPVLPKNGDFFRTVTGPPKFVNGVAVISKNGLYGVIDKSGIIIVPIAYQFLTHFKNNLAVFQKDLSVPNSKGVIDTKGNIIAKPKHENIWIEDNNVIRYHLVDGVYTNFYGFYNNKGEDNKESHFEYLSVFDNGVAIYGSKKAPNYWGIVDAAGNNNPLKEKYRVNIKEYDPFKKGFLYATGLESKKMLVLNTKGERVSNCEYDYLFEVNDGIAFGSKENNKASFYNNKDCSLIYESDVDGKERSNYFFTTMTGLHPFKGGYAAIKKGSADYTKKEYEYILIDKNGKTTYSVWGGKDCKLNPSDSEAGIFMYSEIDFADFKKPSYRTYLKGDGTVLYKGLTGCQDFKDGMAAVLNRVE